VPTVGRGVLAALLPWRSAGSLLNHLGEVSGPEEVAAAYPPGVADRLRAVKRAVDPDGVFAFGHVL
jgi:FAD/FMN-containing dehydrogenase